jgi:hypothetical protein
MNRSVYAENAKAIAFQCGDTFVGKFGSATLQELICCAQALRKALLEKNPAKPEKNRANAIEKDKDGKETLVPWTRQIPEDASSSQACKDEAGAPAQSTGSELNRALAVTEGVLRDRADKIVSSIEANQKMMTNNVQTQPSSTDTNSEALRQQGDDLESDLQAIKSVVSVRDRTLFLNFEDYDGYFFRLNTGYEFINFSSSFDKGFLREAFLVSLKLGGTTINDLVEGFHLCRYGYNLSFAAALTNSAETTVTLPESGGAAATRADDQNTSDKATRSFEFDLQLFAPFHRSVEKRTTNTTVSSLRNRSGFLLSVGGLKGSENKRNALRTYAGFRSAANPELYWDVLYGKTEGLRSRRIEARGQLPVRQLQNGDRIYLGAIGNFAVDKKHPGESDVIRLYLSWNADITSIFGTPGKAK